MIIRIVKMTFRADTSNAFLQLFGQSEYSIRQFPGCLHLELLQDTTNKNVFYTYSHWTDQEALEQYRKSDFFQATWAQTKQLFEAKPEAVSLRQVSRVE